ncbi:hypothetical protein [Bradyrhizobium sp. I1.7.5]|uniref:hypothetical protein n=1 Tax=Bradyrhizobium sp. I1.7.5 TaxID=3156363 RepID=UPI0033969C75
MAVFGVLLFLVCAISVIYPLRFLMIPNRIVAVCGVIVSFIMIGAGAPPPSRRCRYAVADLHKLRRMQERHQRRPEMLSRISVQSVRQQQPLDF